MGITHNKNWSFAARLAAGLAGLVLALSLTVCCGGSNAEGPPGKTANETGNKDPAPTACQSAADCVPAQCCHAQTCVAKSAAPDCTDIRCSMDCAPQTMDCGAGQCACEQGHCAVTWTSTP